MNAFSKVFVVAAAGTVGLLAACSDDSTSGGSGNLALDGGNGLTLPDGSGSTPIDAGVDACTGCSDLAASLGGLRWEIPCTNDLGGTACGATDPDTKNVTLAGETGATYDVTLRFRGVVEAQTYGNVATTPVATGTNAGYFAPGATYTPNGKNTYRLDISAPAFTAYLNYEAGKTVSELQAYCFPIDYTVTIPIAAGAKVTLFATAADGVQYKNVDAQNQPIVVPGITPAPAAYPGQFVQMDVVSITKR